MNSIFVVLICLLVIARMNACTLILMTFIVCVMKLKHLENKTGTMPSFELQFKTQVGEVAHAVTLQHTPQYTFFSDYAKYACAQCKALGKKRTWPLVRGKCACALRIVQSVYKAKHILNSESFSTLNRLSTNFAQTGYFLWFRIPLHLFISVCCCWLWLCFLRVLGQLDLASGLHVKENLVQVV